MDLNRNYTRKENYIFDSTVHILVGSTLSVTNEDPHCKRPSFRLIQLTTFFIKQG